MPETSKEDVVAEGEAGIDPEEKIEIEQLDDPEGGGEEAEAAPERDKWGSKVSYILTLVGYAVGFGNFWRFPYQVRENGGLVFLIPYFIMLFLVGLPLFFLELAVGQRRRKGLLMAWQEISPTLGGIGIACAWLCFMVSLYYNTLLAYCISYLFDSFTDTLPWKNCTTIAAATDEKDFIFDECTHEMGGRATKYYWFKRTLDASTGIDDPGNFNWWIFAYLIVSWVLIWAILIKGTESVGKVVYFTAVFPYVVLIAFFIGTLSIEPGKGWLGAYRLAKPNWDLLYHPITWLKAGTQIFYSLGLAEGCLVVFASYNPARNNCFRDAVLISVVNCSTSCFAALVVFPIIGLLGHTKYDECVKEMVGFLPGSKLKTRHSDKYDIYFFTNAKTWGDVDGGVNNITIRYGYGELHGDILTGYNRKQDPAEADTLVLEEVHQKHINPDLDLTKNVADYLRTCSIGKEATESGGGTGFVFIGFTEAVLRMPAPTFWAILFFFMLFTLGIDSGFGCVEGFVAALEDFTHWKRWKCTTISCGALLFFAIVLFPFGWGTYVLDLLDQWTANWTLLVIALLECIAVAWDYGLAKIAYDCRLMTGSKPSLYILLCWKYISPATCILLLLGSVITYTITIVKSGGIKYTIFNPQDKNAVIGDVSVHMPAYSIVVGFLLMIFCVLWMFAYCIIRKSKLPLFKDEAPGDFPEDELRQERHIDVEREEDQFTAAEKKIMGRQSIQNLQDYRDTLSQGGGSIGPDGRRRSLSNKSSTSIAKSKDKR